MSSLDKIWIAVLMIAIVCAFVWGTLFAVAQVKVEATVKPNPCNECVRICNQLK